MVMKVNDTLNIIYHEQETVSVAMKVNDTLNIIYHGQETVFGGDG